jgi:CNT family concentrative nucleoside transporter
VNRFLPFVIPLALLALAWAQESPEGPAKGGAGGVEARADGGEGVKQRAEKPPRTPKQENSAAARMGSTFKDETVGWGLRLRGVLGYGLILLIGYLLSTSRDRIRWRTVLWGLGLQAIFALIVLNPVVGDFFFNSVDRGVKALLGFAEAGMDFVFSATVPHKVTYINAEGRTVTEIIIGHISPVLKSFAFWILPTVIFFSSLITLLYHLGVMQWVVKGMARAMVYMMGTSGAETLSCTANIFVGQTEAPLLVKPFVDKMTMSELMAVMTGGFATVAGGVLAIYVMMLQGIPGIAGHLVTASIMAAPCALAVAKLMFPETDAPTTGGQIQVQVERPDQNAIEAAARGASEGMTLVLNIAAMLIAFVGLMAMLNAVLHLFGTSVEQILGWILSPLAWCMGVPWDGQASQVGQLMGEKLVLTELIAYKHLQGILSGNAAILSRRTAVISSYALCGFANVASIGIQIGGIGGMAPARRGDLARLGLRAMFAGAMVSSLSGTLAGFLV